MLQVGSAQQVMLEVKVAEVSRILLEKLGVRATASGSAGDIRYSIVSNFLSGAGGVLGVVGRSGVAVNLDAEKQDGLVRVLAEPNIVAISGQEASFLAGGTIYIPTGRTVTSPTGGGVQTVTTSSEPQEFGVSVRFTPTVLDGDLINLRVAPEVSEVVATGSGADADSPPRLTRRRAETTVQLRDGQSFAIAGLIKNNVAETIRKFPVLGDVPILGALFRSSEFQTDRSELMFIITPRLVKPLPASPPNPTDGWIPPNRTEFFINGQLEGSGHPDVPMTNNPNPSAAPAGAGGFQLR
jgi:pilus assembly protein CpaC